MELSEELKKAVVDVQSAHVLTSTTDIVFEGGLVYFENEYGHILACMSEDVYYEVMVWKFDSGDYQHYKGSQYRALDLYKNADTQELMVRYRKVKDGNPVDLPWGRRLVEWNQLVTWPDGTVKPRFVKLVNLPKGPQV